MKKVFSGCYGRYDYWIVEEDGYYFWEDEVSMSDDWFDSISEAKRAYEDFIDSELK